MARPGLTQNRKWRRLVRDLGSAAVARGSLEFIWDACYEAGDDFLGTDADVELAAQWAGEPGALVRALSSAGEPGAGFIEPDPERTGWRVHQLFENAPEYVQKRMLREIARNERGESISAIRSAAGKKGKALQIARQTAATVWQTEATVRRLPDVCHQKQANGGNCLANGETPAPAPAPAPLKESSNEDSSSSCAEPPPEPPAPESPVVLTLPCVSAKTWNITEATLKDWQEAFPALDPLAEARRMKLWLEQNPKNRKTFAGMGKFTLGWLGRAQDRARPSTPGVIRDRTPQHHRSATDQRYLAQLPGGGISFPPPHAGEAFGQDDDPLSQV